MVCKPVVEFVTDNARESCIVDFSYCMNDKGIFASVVLNSHEKDNIDKTTKKGKVKYLSINTDR